MEEKEKIVPSENLDEKQSNSFKSDIPTIEGTEEEDISAIAWRVVSYIALPTTLFSYYFFGFDRLTRNLSIFSVVIYLVNLISWVYSKLKYRKTNQNTETKGGNNQEVSKYSTRLYFIEIVLFFLLLIGLDYRVDDITMMSPMQGLLWAVVPLIVAVIFITKVLLSVPRGHKGNNNNEEEYRFEESILGTNIKAIKQSQSLVVRLMCMIRLFSVILASAIYTVFTYLIVGLVIKALSFDLNIIRQTVHQGMLAMEKLTYILIPTVCIFLCSSHFVKTNQKKNVGE